MPKEGVVSKEDIGKGHALPAQPPDGPLELADLTGLDTNLRVAEALKRRSASASGLRTPGVTT